MDFIRGSLNTENQIHQEGCLFHEYTYISDISLNSNSQKSVFRCSQCLKANKGEYFLNIRQVIDTPDKFVFDSWPRISKDLHDQIRQAFLFEDENNVSRVTKFFQEQRKVIFSKFDSIEIEMIRQANLADQFKSEVIQQYNQSLRKADIKRVLVSSSSMQEKSNQINGIIQNVLANSDDIELNLSSMIFNYRENIERIDQNSLLESLHNQINDCFPKSIKKQKNSDSEQPENDILKPNNSNQGIPKQSVGLNNDKDLPKQQVRFMTSQSNDFQQILQQPPKQLAMSYRNPQVQLQNKQPQIFPFYSPNLNRQNSLKTENNKSPRQIASQSFNNFNNQDLQQNIRNSVNEEAPLKATASFRQIEKSKSPVFSNTLTLNQLIPSSQEFPNQQVPYFSQNQIPNQSYQTLPAQPLRAQIPSLNNNSNQMNPIRQLIPNQSNQNNQQQNLKNFFGQNPVKQIKAPSVSLKTGVLDLDLSNRGIKFGNLEFDELCIEIQKNGSLVELKLNLENNSICLNGFTQFYEMVSGLDTVKKLEINLSKNRIESEGFSLIYFVCLEKQNLEEFSLDFSEQNQVIKEDQITKEFVNMRNNNTLKSLKLNLRKCEITFKGALKLGFDILGFKQLSSLEVNFEDNKLTEEEKVLIKTMFQSKNTNYKIIL